MPFVRVGDRAPVDVALRQHLVARLGPFEAACLLTGSPDVAAEVAGQALQARLTKPPGSLGRVESIGVQLAGISGECPPPLPEPAVVAVFAGDHGVLVQGVSPWPQEVTAQMVANFCAGGAAANVLARQVGAAVAVVDVGVATPLPDVPGTERSLPTGRLPQTLVLLDRNVRAGTRDLSTGPALTTDEARQALDVGAQLAFDLADRGARLLVTGDMGIGNTTPAAALIAALCGKDASVVTGRGTGIDDVTLTLKTAVVANALARVGPADDQAPLDVLAELGGLEHAALAGFIIGGVAAGQPVLVDGVIAVSGLVVAEALAPGVVSGVIAGHRSVEPGASAALTALRLEPVLDLGMRLGEGSGALLAVPIVVAAARLMGEMATFDSAGVTEK
ncbi:MAG: nicotinate-nucleotide--dimethylbenzimidazole phosphoribosyltransferase [Acidimicrobiales bacterium]